MSFRSIAGGIVRCTFCVTVAALVPDSAAAQRNDCALQVQAVAGPAGYQKRDYGCEGFFVQPQANLNVKVLSLRQGNLALFSANELLIAVPKLPDSLATRVSVFGVGLTSGLNWALDGTARPNAPMRWRVSEVVRGNGLVATSLGLLARTVSGDRFATPWYVAVRVGAAQLEIDSLETKSTQTTDLVLHIPAAGALQWRAHANDPWTSAKSMDGDGRFRCAIPAGLHGPLELALHWRPRGAKDWGDIETIRLWLW